MTRRTKRHKQSTKAPNRRRPRPGATRTSLLLAAVEEFATHGVAGTTISRITTAAGARNPSALHYHFGTKAGLVEQLILLIQQWFDEARAARLEDLEARMAAGETPPLRDALELFVRPYARIIQEKPWGLAAIRFIATLEFEQQQEGWERLYQHTSEIAQRLSRLVAASAGSDPADISTRRLVFFCDSVIQGFATHKHLGLSFFGNAQAPSIDALADFYVECGERLLAHDQGAGSR